MFYFYKTATFNYLDNFCNLAYNQPNMYLLPITTTVMAFIFFAILLRDYLRRSHTLYMLWLAVGLAAYGASAFAESIHALMGFHAANFKLWYISGALFGGWSLVTGMLYLILQKKTADIMMLTGLAYIAVVAVYCMLSPVNPIEEGIRLSGSAFEWDFIRPMTMVIHLMSFALLTGAAFFAAFQFSKSNRFKSRFVGILSISAGGLMPGLGRSHNDIGISSSFYLLELLSLLFIFSGCLILKNEKNVAVKEFHAKINS